MLSSGNDAGSILGETVVALALVGLLTMLVLQLTVTSRESRLERAQLEQMMAIAHAYLAEAHLGDCALSTPTDPDEPCFAPLRSHQTEPPVDPNNPAHLTDFVVTELDGRRLRYQVSLTDGYSPTQPFGRNWPIRTVEITDVTGRLTLERSALGRPL